MGLGGRKCAMQGSTVAAYHEKMIHGADRLFAKRREHVQVDGVQASSESSHEKADRHALQEQNTS